ncbi:MAG: hypothetical protein IPN40_09685 [Uliginosibacterium sp.]|nr:hypothetical protein [Uliginosibacterium sp.]
MLVERMILRLSTSSERFETEVREVRFFTILLMLCKNYSNALETQSASHSSLIGLAMLGSTRR